MKLPPVLWLLSVGLVGCSGNVTITASGDTGTVATDDTATQGAGDTADSPTETAEPLLDVDGDGWTTDEDCDDSDAERFPGADELCNEVDDDCDDAVDEDPVDSEFWYPDDDGDGYGRSEDGLEACEAPRGYTEYDGDCDDTDGRYHPGAAEDDCTVAHDYNCDGSSQYEDSDGDLIPACEDCDDGDAFSFPGSPESCDDSDNDCDGDVDEDAIDATTWYGDSDGDGHGGTTFTQDACEAPDGYVAAADDCDDLDASAFPGGTEVCDEGDNDCDGGVDEGVGTTFYADADHDGYGDPEDSADGCSEPVGYTSDDQDCDDTDPSAHPGGVEVCDGADNDCDGDVDAGALDAETWFPDSDGDGYGASDGSSEACEAPSGAVLDDSDCDDGDSSVNPGSKEVCDDADNDCDGQTDDEDGDLDASTGTVFYVDGDGDGHGGTGTLQACELPGGASTTSLDCDDTDAAVNPDATEVCNGLDDDCDSDVDDADGDLDTSTGSSWYADSDGDGYGDIDGETLACEAVSGTVANAEDCDDSTGDVGPDGDEICGDGIDNDCNGDVDEEGAIDVESWYADTDGDGYGDESVSTLACEAPSDHVEEGGDCDDDDSDVHPGAATGCDGSDRDCDGEVDGDTDGDGIVDGCPDGSECSAHTDCDNGYCGPTSAMCVTLNEITLATHTTTQTGDMGGISGADALCASDASAYGYSGTWVAFLSDDSHDLSDLFPDTDTSSSGALRDIVPIENLQGTTIVGSWNEVLSGTSSGAYVYAFDGDPPEEEYGYDNDADGWHGSNNDGTVYSGQTCSNWTSTSGVGVGMELDAYQLLGSLELDKACSTTYALLCMKVED